MRPQLLGFIYKKNKDTGELILSGVRLCDLDNIIRKNTINISYEIISPALFNSGATTFAVSPQGANGSVLMDASVESVIEQLKAGVKISGLRYNAHKKNSRYKGLEEIKESFRECESLFSLNLDNCTKLCSVTKSILFCSIEHVKLDVLDAIEIRYSFISLNNLRTVAIYSKSNTIFI